MKDQNQLRTTRRQFLKVLGAGSVLALSAPLLAACSQPSAPAPTTAPAAAPTTAPAAPTTAPAAAPTATAAATTAAAEPTATAAPVAATPTPAPAAAAKPAEVPRNRTLILMWSGVQGKYVDQELWNPYAIGANHQNGPGLFVEPLWYYSAFADKYYPWLAESYEFNSDSTQLTIKLRSGITWSDGVPFSADDVAYTYNTLASYGAKVRFGVNAQEVIKEAKALDPTTVQVTFKKPTPRWVEFAAYKYDIGVYIVPKHIYEGQDWTSFKHYDMEKGWPVTTGPWKLVFASQDQKIIDLRDDWWAVKQGLVPQMPAVKRIVYLPIANDTQAAQAFITNQIDCSLDLRPVTIKQVLAQNPKIITHTGREAPYGYTDWWPTSLYVNNSKPPFDKPDVRWALSYFIDRDQVISVGYQGAGSKSQLPMPKYPPLMPYFDAVKDLLKEYDTNEFNPQKGADRLTKAGYTKGSDGMWVDAQGNKITVPIIGAQIFADIGPVISELLKKQGIDATYSQPPDFDTQTSNATYTAALYGHGGAVQDPYDTLRLYLGSEAGAYGAHGVNMSMWKNDKFDAIVNEMSVTSLDQKDKLLDQFKRAMEIWLPELPDIQITEWYHRIPMNTTYWTNWPTKDNPYVNGAFWHLTFQLILNNLKPAQ